MVDTPEEVPEGAAVIIRSHGECRAVHEALSNRGLRVIDATCPNVSRIHQIVAQAEDEGRQVVIIGTPDHPEVKAIAGWCRHPVVAEGPSELEAWLTENPKNREKMLTLVAQTTSIQTIWESSAEKTKKECREAS